MRTSATGRPTSSARTAVGGFTLIEILVVVLIIGLMAVGVTLSLGTIGEDRELDKERDRVLTIAGYLREQATMQNREYGMRCFDGGYEFLVFDARRDSWETLQEDPLLRRRLLPGGIGLQLTVEGRRIVLPRPDEEQVRPQIMLMSSGEVSDFELLLERDDGNDSTSRASSVRILPESPAGELITRVGGDSA